MYCACHATSSRGHGGANPCRSSFRKLCALRLPHNTSCGHGGANPRRSSFRRLCVLRLPRNKTRPRRRQSTPQLLQEALSTAPATQQLAAATAAPIRAAAPSGGSLYCACHATSSRGHCGANPRRSSCNKLCVLRLLHNKQPRPLRRQSAPQLLQEALCTAPATQQVAAATAAPIRAAAPVTSSAYCACYTTSSRGHGGANPRRSSFRRALCTAPATQQVAAATAAPIRAAAPSGGSLYCACHATSSRGHCGANPRRSSFRRLSVLRLPRNK